MAFTASATDSLLATTMTGKSRPAFAKRGNAFGTAGFVPIGDQRGLDLAAMGALKQSDGGLDAVGANRDPARPRRNGGDETSLGWVGFDQQ